jgi:hypothetical protein
MTPPPLPLSIQLVQRKIYHYTNLTEPYRRLISQHFYHYSSCFKRILKVQCHKIFQKLLFSHKKLEVRKSLLLLILKNFQWSKIITDIYRFPPGLDTTDLFQIQASTEDSKKTYSEDRLFSRLPLPSSLPRMWIRGYEPCCFARTPTWRWNIYTIL